MIATWHVSHAAYVLQAIEAGKHVFCDKPQCLTLQELERIESLCRRLAEEGRALVLRGMIKRCGRAR